MAIILGIETATNVCSVCLQKDSDILSFRESDKKNSHTATITTFIKSCIEEAGISYKDLNAISVSKGPGSYTGLRVGVSTAKGMAFALGIPLMAIDTLDYLSQTIKADPGDIIIPMIDARRMEVYAKVYDHTGQILENLNNWIIDNASFEEYLSKNSKIFMLGDGADKCKAVLKDPKFVVKQQFCSAKAMVNLNLEHFRNKNFENISDFSPLYFKAPNITKSKQLL